MAFISPVARNRRRLYLARAAPFFLAVLFLLMLRASMKVMCGWGGNDGGIRNPALPCRPSWPKSGQVHQTLVQQAGVLVVGDDDVIQDRNAHHLAHLHQLFGHLDIFL